MNSAWTREVVGIFRKEAQTELRSRTGLVTSLVFSLATIVTVSLALFNKDANEPDLQAVCSSLVWTILLFASLLSLPRSFLIEEEQGTGDLLRLCCRPHAVFWGKVLFNVLQVWFLCLLVGGLFVMFTGIRVLHPVLFVGTLAGGGAALASAVTLCGAIASHAANRAALAGMIAIPLVILPSQWGVTGLSASFGAGLEYGGNVAVVGLSAYAAASLALGPWIYAGVWKS